MSTTLDDWQQRLESHFSGLSESREGTGFPVFALEHGLTEEEFELLASQLRQHLAKGASLRQHWLAWVVYATEFGYDYAGGEYWDSFEAATSRWTWYGNRTTLRNWFKRFQSRYNGVIPSGPWADQFSIIAWPITHSILPKYLQYQFAQALYNIRYSLARVDTADPVALGRLLAHQSYDASSRFGEFLQQESLSGRIVIALLHGKIDGQSPIYEPTLDRLVRDLEDVRRAREWLKEARTFISNRMLGTGRSGSLFRDSPSVRPTVAVQRQPANLKPTLLLRRSEPGTWNPIIELPAFSAVAKLNPEFASFLKGTRCKVSGLPDTWFPPAWLLGSEQRRALKQWPALNAPVLTFERPNKALQNLLDAECRIPRGPIWLFKLQRDGIAHLVEGLSVRPGSRYIVVSNNAIECDDALWHPCSLTCEGMFAVGLDLPPTLTNEDSAKFVKLGLQVCHTIRVAPAGLFARNWDGEGSSEWLTTESPAFSIVHDHPVDGYEIRLNDDPGVALEGAKAGYPQFIRVSPLPPGRHKLSVRAFRVGSSSAMAAQAFTRDTEGTIALVVRDPEPWTPGTTLYSGLAVRADPPDPTLDILWEGECDLTILGPAHRQVSLQIALHGRDGRSLLDEKLGPFELPLLPKDWRQRWSQFVGNDGRAWKYLEASSGLLTINGDELGQFNLRLERETRPIRWVCRDSNHRALVRLIDDTGSEEQRELSFYPFDHPLTASPLEDEASLTGMVANGAGGLYVAKNTEHVDHLVASSGNVAGGLQGLLTEPPNISADLNQFPDVIRVLGYWASARLAGPLSGLRRGHVVNRVTTKLLGNIFGPRWEAAETALIRQPDSADLLQVLQQTIGGKSGFSVAVANHFNEIASVDRLNCERFSQLASRYHICADAALCEFALCFAATPWIAVRRYQERFAGLLSTAKDHQILLRAARMVAIWATGRDQTRAHAFAPRWSW
jgi:hypothetical protein